MTTPLEKPLRRALTIDHEPWVLTITPDGLKLTRKGRRKGPEIGWKAIVGGDAALAAALNASLRAPSRGERLRMDGPSSPVRSGRSLGTKRGSARPRPPRRGPRAKRARP